MQWHAPISGCPVTQPIASNRETMVYVKPTNSSPLLRNQSHVDNGLMEHIVYLHLGHISLANVTV